VSVIDIDQNIIVHEVPTGAEPEGVLVSEDGKTLYVTSEVSDLVHMIDPDGGFVTADVVVGTRPPPGMRKTDVTPVGLVMTKDGRTAYVTLGHAAHVAVVDVATRKIAAYILVGKRSWGATLSRDESKLFVANGFGDDVTVIDAKSRNAIISVPVGRIPWGVAIDD
jgi:YVTN family beta-propeller protein